VNSKLLVFSFLAFCIACKPPVKPGPQPATAQAVGPQVRATVVTFQTTVQPGNRTLTNTLTIANGKVRSSAELDSWRLFDLNRKQVTFVDDIGKTFRNESLESLLATRRAALAADVPEGMPRPKIEHGTAKQTIAGTETTPYVISSGGYRRELWIGMPAGVPPQLYAMMLASEQPSTYAVGMMRDVEETLLDVPGFPLRDHIELPVGDRRYVLDRTVTSIEQKDIPSAVLNVAGGYEEVTAKPVLPPPAPKQTLLPAGIPTVAPPAPAPPPPAAKPATKAPAVVKKPAALKKKRVAKKASKKPAPKKSGVRKHDGKKPGAKKPPVKKAPAKKAPAKKAPPKEAAAKKP